jgi:anaerobic selenocysteine-containing dehydrogenase
VRRAAALQASQVMTEGELVAARIHPDTASRFSIRDLQKIQVKQKNHTLILPVILDKCVPQEAVFIAGGLKGTSVLSDLFGPIEISLAPEDV